MLSFCGGILLIFGFGLIGFSAAGIYQSRVAQLEAFVKLIGKIQTQIDCFRTPLGRIFSGYEDFLLQKCGFLPMAEKNASEAFRQSLSHLWLEKREIQLLSDFFGSLGHGTPNEELSRCRFTLSELETILKSAKGNLPQKKKLCRGLGILSGAVCMILFL